MNKTFKFFFVVFLFAIFTTIMFGQNPNQSGQRAFLSSLPVAPNDSSLIVGAVLAPGANLAYDSTTFTGTTNTQWYVKGKSSNTSKYWWNPRAQYESAAKNKGYNIAPWNNGPRVGDNYYIKLQQSTGAGNGFRFANGDTIYIYFASKNTNYRTRFSFDSTSLLRVYTAGQENLTRPNNVIPIFHMLRKGPTSPAGDFVPANAQKVLTNLAGGSPLRAGAADQGLTYDGSTNPDVTNNYVDIGGFNRDTIMMVIDSAVANDYYNNLYFSNIAVVGADSLLQARTMGVDDTIMVAVGKGTNNIYLPNKRASLIVRQDIGSGVTYAQYQPASNTLAPAIYYNQTVLPWTVTSMNADRVTAGLVGWGGAPVVKVTLLPGSAAFVRWNIGPDADWLRDASGEIRGVTNAIVDRNGRVLIGNRRQHARGRYDVSFANYYAALQAPNAKPFKVTDTCTRNNFGSDQGLAVSIPDTMYIMDADSNLTYDNFTYAHMIPLDSATLGEFQSTDIRKVDSVYSVTTGFYRRALRIYNWGFKKAGTDSARIQKIRVRGYIPGTAAWANDTLNAKTDLWAANAPDVAAGYLVGNAATSQFAQGYKWNNIPNYVAAPGTAAYPDSSIWFGPGKPATATVEYRKGAAGSWQVFPVNGVQYTSSEILGSSSANRSGLKMTVKDLYNNPVTDGVVAFLAYPEIGAWTDTTINAKLAGAGLGWFGVGKAIPRAHADGSVLIVPTQTDTLFKFVRDRNDINDPTHLQLHGDDMGVATVDQWMTNCTKSDYYFKFFVFDREDTLNAPIMRSGTGPESKNLVITYGGQGSLQYRVHVNADAFASDIKLSADKSAPPYTRNPSNWHFNADTLLYSTVAAGTACDTNKATLSADLVDACERPIPVLEANKNDIVFSVATWYTRRGYSNPATDSRGTIDYKGSITGTNYIVPGTTSVRTTYNIPNISKDTVTVYATVGGRTDSLKIATISGAPNKMLLSRPYDNTYLQFTGKNTRSKYDSLYRGYHWDGGAYVGSVAINNAATPPTGPLMSIVNDSLINASKGTVYNGIIETQNVGVYGTYPRTWTFVKGYQTDCHYDTVSLASVANRKVVWRLYGATKASMSLADPYKVFGLTGPGGVPNYGGNPVLSYDIPTRGARQMSLGPINNTLTGNAEYHILLVSDTVGGQSYNWALAPQAYNFVFPKEVSSVFNTTNISSDGVTLNNTTYPWSSQSWTDTSWSAPIKPLASGAMGMDATVASEAFDAKAVTNKNGRGYNRLAVLFSNQLDDNAITADTAVETGRKLVYHVIPDTSANMKVAWLDGVGPYFNAVTPTSVTGLFDEDFILTGRQVAQIVNSELTSGTQYAFKRLVVTGNSNNTPIASTNANFTNYAGRIDTLFFREYDRFGNPSQRTGYGEDKLDVIIVGHSSSIQNVNTTQKNGKAQLITGTYYFGVPNSATKTSVGLNHPWDGGTYGLGGGRAKSQGVIDSNGVFVPRTTVVGGPEWGPLQQIPPVATTVTVDSAQKALNQVWLLGSEGNGKLKGAYAIAYQTMFIDGDAGAQSTNCKDTVLFALKERFGTVNTIVPIPDTAVVISIPFDTANPDLAFNGPLNQDTLIRRVDDMDTASVTLSTWGKDYITTVPGSYPIIWWGHPALTKFNNPYMLKIDGPVNVSSVYPTNKDTIVNPNAPIYDMPGFVFDKSINGGNLVDYLAAEFYPTAGVMPLPAAGRKNGIGGGYRLAPQTVVSATTTYQMRTLVFKSYRSGVTKLSVYSTTDAAYYKSLKAMVTYLPYYPHWFSMSNESDKSVHPTWESSYNGTAGFWSWPVRKDYFQPKMNTVSGKMERGKFNPMSGYYGPNALAGYLGTVDGPANRDSLGNYNGALTDAVYRPGPNNPRSYGSTYGQELYPPMDTIFFGDRYVLKVRAFDRWGNRNYYVPLYLTFDVAGNDIAWGASTFNSTAVGGTAQEAYLRQDTSVFGTASHPYQIGDLAKYYVSDSLIVNPLSRSATAPTTILATLAMFYQPDLNNLPYSGTTNVPATFTGWVDGNGVFNRYAQYAQGGNTVDLQGASPVRVQVGYRQLYIKELQNPGNFALNLSSAPTLVRTENGPFTLSWTRSNSTNTYWQAFGDSNRYTVYYVAKKSGGYDTTSFMTATTAIGFGLGFDSTFTWSKTDMETKLGLGTSNMYNRDVKFYVIATNRWGKQTWSTNQTSFITFEKNSKPTALSLNAPVDKATLLVTGDTTYTYFGIDLQILMVLDIRTSYQILRVLQIVL